MQSLILHNRKDNHYQSQTYDKCKLHLARLLFLVQAISLLPFLLQGVSNEISIKLVTHPLIKAVGFTGSFAGGKALFEAAAKREEPIAVYAEMGSINPVFILPEMLEKNGVDVANKLAASNTLSAGQF